MSLGLSSAECSYPPISWVLLHAAVDIYRNPSHLEYKNVQLNSPLFPGDIQKGSTWYLQMDGS